MAVALVGTIGAASQSAVNTAITPAWGASENRVAGNLLVLWITVSGSATLPSLTAAAAGWTIAIQRAGTSCSSTIYTKQANGSDTAPTVGAITSGYVSVQLAEYSGVGSSIAYQTQSAVATTTSPMVATCAAVDYLSGSLVVAGAADFYSAAAAKTLAHTINNATDTETSNAGTSTRRHYNHTHGVTTSKVSATRDSYAFTTTSGTGQALVVATFTPGSWVTGSTTVNAVIKATQTPAGPKVDAVIRKTIEPVGGLKADALVKATVTPDGGFKADVVIKATITPEGERRPTRWSW